MSFQLCSDDLPERLEYGQVLKNLQLSICSHNKKYRQASKNRLKSGHIRLLENIVRLAVKKYNHRKEDRKSIELKSKISSLATLIQVDEKTIRNQLIRLEVFDFVIVQRTFRGIRISINLQLISFLPKRKKLPPLDKELTCESKDNTTSHVDKLISAFRLDGKKTGCQNSKNNRKEGAGSGLKFAGFNPRSGPFSYQTIQFFKELKSTCYPKAIFSMQREHNIKKIIQEQVLTDNFLDPDDVLRYNRMALLKARNWFEKRPKFKIPEPEYFLKKHTNLAFCFSRAKDWLAVSQIERAKLRASRREISFADLVRGIRRYRDNISFKESLNLIK